MALKNDYSRRAMETLAAELCRGTLQSGKRCSLAKLDNHPLPCDDAFSLPTRHKSLSVNVLQRLSLRSSRRDNASYRRYHALYRRYNTASRLRNASSDMSDASSRPCDESSRRSDVLSRQSDGSPSGGNTSYRRCDFSCHHHDASSNGGNASERSFDASYHQQFTSRCQLDVSHIQDEP